MSESKSEKLYELLEKFFGGSEKQEVHAEVVKALDEEQRMALFVVLAPDELDLHGDIYSAEEVELACKSYNVHCRKANLMHRVETEDFMIVQSFINPVSFKMQDDSVIRKGTWLAWVEFSKDELWNEVKAGDWQGLSIGCRANVEDLE
jgi:hypothetical protein